MEETLIEIVVKQDESGEKFIDVLRPGYNIIDYTIYDEKAASQILETMEAARSVWL